MVGQQSTSSPYSTQQATPSWFGSFLFCSLITLVTLLMTYHVSLCLASILSTTVVNPLLLVSALNNNWIITIMITKKSFPCLPPSPPIASPLVFEVAYSHFLLLITSRTVTTLFFWHIFSTTIKQQPLLWSPEIHSHVCLHPPTGSSLASTWFCHLRLFAPISQCASFHCCTGLFSSFIIPL